MSLQNKVEWNVPLLVAMTTNQQGKTTAGINHK
jgi:hypothetical protein